MEQGSITLLDDQVQRGELMAFESSVTVTGMVRYSAPQGLHDDTVIALALANLGAAQAAGLRARATRSQHAGSAYVLSRCSHAPSRPAVRRRLSRLVRLIGSGPGSALRLTVGFLLMLLDVSRLLFRLFAARLRGD